ncbi:putative salt-induced outer membrane protein YdiY [Pararhizobium capsulatum DSM 1112]|uniref:Salt-induced outer membrane protein YdiY n=1 Tax=Pararhizobium capsulatum DSM 1112 TaxID=1121113 RepID=A0ABU0BMU9_9HYPH|nr:hypothetical protein [Pararhizobium capsulatum]MDQ0319044.1 putative salt-induced outer membrane protein YdiY [Pararhizobium capsulatum DSM 1112]
MTTKMHAHNKSVALAVWTAFLLMGLPSSSFSETFEQTQKFCKISQMLIPIFLDGGKISGESVCKASGVASYNCTSNMSLGQGICMASGVASYNCTSNMSLGQGVCMASGVASYNCTSNMSLGQGVCMASGVASYNCTSGMKYAQGVCMAGGVASYNCTSGMTLGAAVCMSGGVASYQCSGAGHDDLGEGICLALGGSSTQCSGMPVHQAVCGFTGNCKGDDALSIAVSMVEACGPKVLHFGIE